MIDSSTMGLKEIADTCGFKNSPRHAANVPTCFWHYCKANMQAALSGRNARRRRSRRVSASVLRLPESLNAVENSSPNCLGGLKPFPARLSEDRK